MTSKHYKNSLESNDLKTVADMPASNRIKSGRCGRKYLRWCPLSMPEKKFSSISPRLKYLCSLFI